MITAATPIDPQVVGLFAALGVALAAAIWRLASLRADNQKEWGSRIDVCAAGLDERAVEVLVRLQGQISRTIQLPSEPFDPGRALADPGDLAQLVSRYSALASSKRKLEAQFSLILRAGPLLIWLLAPQFVLLLLECLYYSGITRARTVAQISLFVTLGLGLMAAAVALVYIVVLNSLARAESLASADPGMES